MKSAMTYHVAAFYRFTPVADPAALRADLKARWVTLDLCGSLLIAHEGINSTMAGSREALQQVLSDLHQAVGLTHEEVKWSLADVKPFNRLKIRLKKEIVTLGQPDVDPTKKVGTYVEPENWNDLIKDPEVLVLDTRNTYETRIGIFKGAVDPNIATFRGFADYVEANLDPQKHKKVAMFCTGGIRCEKASSYMLQKGFETVYHLKGGILKYLETIPEQQSLWEGACYVFDHRMGVEHGLSSGNFMMCFSCGEALSHEDQQHPLFEDGVACAHCYHKTSDADKARFRERHRQIKLAEKRAKKQKQS